MKKKLVSISMVSGNIMFISSSRGDKRIRR